MSDLYPLVEEAIRGRRPVAVATVIAGPGVGRKMLVWPHDPPVGSLGLGEPQPQFIDLDTAELDDRVEQEARRLLAEQQAGRLAFTVAGEKMEVFVDVFTPPPVLLIVGAVHIAIPLVTIARTLGFRTVVLDARSAFATEARFGHADELIVGWPADTMAEMGARGLPDSATYVVVLTHDEKIDNPALMYALQHPVRYVGALGARSTHAKRVAALKEMGVSEQALARIHAPIGLDLGGRRPEEIALAIMAEIVAVQNGRQL